MRKASIRSLANIVFFLAAALGINSTAMAQTAPPADGSKGPDILGIRTGMTPQQAYDLLKGIDPAHRVTVGLVPIPPLLGDKAAAYAMAPENLNNGNDGNMNVFLTLPPNPQQVWEVHRQLNGSIHTTLDQIIASLRQKYGQEYSPPLGGSPSIVWLYDEQGKSANGTRDPMNLKNCVFSWMQAITTGNMPFGPQPVQPGVLSTAYGVNGPFQIGPILDPTKNPPCKGLVIVRASISGGESNGVFNYSLDVSINDFTLQNNAAYALDVVLNNATNKKEQQDLNKAKQQSVPAL